MTEVEQYVRDRVSTTCKPCLMLPPDRVPSLRACLLSERFAEGDSAYVLLGPSAPVSDALEAWVRETASALSLVRRWVPLLPAGVSFIEEDGACDVIRHVEASALGLSLLQLALNRAGSGLAIEWTRW